MSRPERCAPALAEIIGVKQDSYGTKGRYPPQFDVSLMWLALKNGLEPTLCCHRLDLNQVRLTAPRHKVRDIKGIEDFVNAVAPQI